MQRVLLNIWYLWIYFVFQVNGFLQLFSQWSSQELISVEDKEVR